MARALPIMDEVVGVGGAAAAGVGNGLLWEYANLSTTWRALITGGVGLSSLMGAIFTRGLVSQSLGGLAAGSVGALSFAMVPIVARPAAGTVAGRTIGTRALTAGTRVGATPLHNLLRVG